MRFSRLRARKGSRDAARPNTAAGISQLRPRSYSGRLGTTGMLMPWAVRVQSTLVISAPMQARG